MNAPTSLIPTSKSACPGSLLDVFIRAGLVFAMAVLCYQIFSPFIALMAWALILAVTLYPAHQKLARRMGGKQGLAATAAGAGRHRADRTAYCRADGRAGRFGS